MSFFGQKSIDIKEYQKTSVTIRSAGLIKINIILH